MELLGVTSLSINIEELTNVEVDVITYLVWRVMVGEDEWFNKGLKELANNVNRHEKSISDAVKSLEAKGMIQTEKKGRRLRIKHTLTNDELYTRIAFIDSMFCNVQSIKELQEDLIREIERIKEDIIITKEINFVKQENDKIIDTAIQQITNAEIDELLDNFVKRTYANSNKLIQEIVKDALQNFREEVFGKYGGISEDYNKKEDKQDIYENFWRNG